MPFTLPQKKSLGTSASLSRSCARGRTIFSPRSSGDELCFAKLVAEAPTPRVITKVFIVGCGVGVAFVARY